jgi:hypothetical protein
VRPAPEPPEDAIVCVDCGGVAHLLTTWPADDPPAPGDVLVYRCADCWDRWDVVVAGGAAGGPGGAGVAAAGPPHDPGGAVSS